MNPETVDNEYAKLQQQADQVGGAIQAFAQKLQTAAGAGDANAGEWLLDLKSIGLEMQQEQLQIRSLLQAVHDSTVTHLTTPEYQPASYQAASPVYAAQPGYNMQQGGGGGFLSRIVGGGFGRAMVTGAGFGIGDDIIDSIL